MQINLVLQIYTKQQKRPPLLYDVYVQKGIIQAYLFIRFKVAKVRFLSNHKRRLKVSFSFYWIYNSEYADFWQNM